MVFSTPLFLCVFLPVALAAYFASPRWLRLVTLTLVSGVFYAWSGPWFLLILLWTTVVDYLAGAVIAGDLGGDLGREPSPRWRRLVVIGSLTNSIGLLAFFKYGPPVLGTLAGETPLGELATRIVLPAGISFYTFESISYVIDLYRHGAASAGRPYLLRAGASRGARLIAHLRGFIAFACYIVQFPHLVAGPIIRFRELQQQLLHPRPGAKRFARGTIRFCIGLAKKVLIADTLAVGVDAVFPVGGASIGYAWCAAAAFALQIYFDFSGYTDMAIGLAMMLGFRFPENFDSPYRAITLTEFWRRWHMTLSRWLRDYVYIPLGGNRLGRERTAANLLVTMLIAGAWHGAGLGFILWGLMHGIVLAIERYASPARPVTPLKRLARRSITLLFLLVSWVFFRSTDLGLTMLMLLTMVNPFATTFDPAVTSAIGQWHFIAALLVGAGVALMGVPAQHLAKHVNLRTTLFAMVLFVPALIVLLMRTSVPFLYFRF